MVAFHLDKDFVICGGTNNKSMYFPAARCRLVSIHHKISFVATQAPIISRTMRKSVAAKVRRHNTLTQLRNAPIRVSQRGESDDSDVRAVRQPTESFRPIIDVNAAAEFECLWREHATSRMPFSELSNRVSEKITTLTINVQTSHLWDNLALCTTLLECALPKCLVALLSREVILKRLPESYTRAVFASQLANRFIYQVGLAAPEFAFYEFVQSLSLSAIA